MFKEDKYMKYDFLEAGEAAGICEYCETNISFARKHNLRVIKDLGSGDIVGVEIDIERWKDNTESDIKHFYDKEGNLIDVNMNNIGFIKKEDF